MTKLGWGRITAFGAGDFAFNLYWQSISLYLLFYYTEAVGLSAAAGGLVYMVASIWDGMIDPVIGVAIERTRSRWGRYRPYLLFGAIPLAVGFGLLYYRPPLTGTTLIVAVMAAHLLFRSLYALVNVPYAALTARITRDSTERARLAGARMIFATLAAITVALSTQRIAVFVTGRADGAQGFFVAACLFALIATPILFFLFTTIREPSSPKEMRAPSIGRDYWRSLARNRALWTLLISGTLMIISYAALGKSVLYYFKYVLNDEASGSVALAVSSGTGLVIVPLWMVAARYASKRTIWLAACGLFAAGLVFFAVIDIFVSWQMIAFLSYMQIGYLGLAFAYWGMLPDTVEYGEWRTGVRAEAVVFGIALLVQKVALGIGVGAFGAALNYVGFHPNQTQSAATLVGLKAIMVALPLAGVTLCAIVMFFNPLRRGVHERIVAEIAAQQTTGDPA